MPRADKGALPAGKKISDFITRITVNLDDDEQEDTGDVCTHYHTDHSVVFTARYRAGYRVARSVDGTGLRVSKAALRSPELTKWRREGAGEGQVVVPEYTPKFRQTRRRNGNKTQFSLISDKLIVFKGG
uniref:Uncharacterized protein n=1 Tax=Branchiostoma floridae TaxID=7739 RepID=C3ZXH7_BRAFL|eukprot:XP_002586745.1 hypothetical protein BRAFLDRAFT_105743 [Branchiostoma floridae]